MYVKISHMLHICNFIEYSEKCFLRSFELKKNKLYLKGCSIYRLIYTMYRKIKAIFISEYKLDFDTC